MTWLILYLIVGLLWGYFTDIGEADLDLDIRTLWMCRISSVLLWPVELIMIIWILVSG